MDIEIKGWLYDILNSINEIESFLLGSPKEFTAYLNDLKTRRAVERNIEIIGEAMMIGFFKKTAPLNFLIQEKL